MGNPVKPYYDEDGITIYHGDCREVLPSISGDAVVTDPPFGIGWGRATWTDNPADYPILIKWLVGEAQRIGGWCFIFQSMTTCASWHEWFPDGWRIFAACKNFAQVRPTGVWHSWNPVIFWYSGETMPKRSGATLNRDYHVGNTAGVFREVNDHPSPRPLDTMRHLVQLAVPEGGVVVDPFMGSGTTLRAAKDTSRQAIGIEIEERYCEIAVERLAQGVLEFG